MGDRTQRGAEARSGRVTVLHNKHKPKGWLRRLGDKLIAWIEAEEERSAQRKVATRQEREARERGKRIGAEIRAKIEADEAKGVDGRLEEKFVQYQGGLITLEQYRDEILFELEMLRDERVALKANRRAMSSHEYEMEMDRIEDNREAVSWRYEWAKDKLGQGKGGVKAQTMSGKWARFIYEDRYGNVSKKTVTMWSQSDRYVVGYDREKQEERTFNVEGISEWQAG